MVVFFSSYVMMNDYINKWHYDKNLKVMEKIKNNKFVAIEPRKDKKQFEHDWKKFKEVCSTNYIPYSKNTEKNGGLYFAVAGAKLSEGIDFTDGMARLVVVVGIPFKNFMSNSVKIKQKYLDKVIQEQKAFNDPEYINGN
jgi:chromosome transmission fidelity protein 1